MSGARAIRAAALTAIVTVLRPPKVPRPAPVKALTMPCARHGASSRRRNLAQFAAEVVADSTAIADVTGRTTDFLKAAGVDARAVHHVVLVIEEILTNIATHGGAPAEPAQVRIAVEPKRVAGKIIDAGAAFDPRGAPLPDVQADVNDRLVGGLGLFLVNRLTSELTYSRQDGHNRFRLRALLRTCIGIVDIVITEQPHGPGAAGDRSKTARRQHQRCIFQLHRR